MAEHGDLIEAVHRHAVGFIESIGGPIRRLKVTAGEVTLEAEWADPAALADAADRHAAAADGATSNGQGPDGVASGAALVAATVDAHGTRAAATAASVTLNGAAATLVAVIPSPTVGTFYRCPEPGAEPFVKEGDLVTPGQQVAILEAMKMMNPIHALTAGRITRILVEDAAAVEYGQALFALEES
ncbi:acetyl-CoA carboxylase biotin carboxyl carrier protein [Nonomuraea cavernae]|uniref:acetyl-CoA carboxylase biotin carboxyl carrier protein n=1 Tax=Nonomuraea cavernae TaxID=2045107 RepID=UPI003400B1F3